MTIINVRKLNKLGLLVMCLIVLLSLYGIVKAQSKDKFSIKEAFKGYSTEESHNFVSDFGLSDTLVVGRKSLWFGTNSSQIFPTAIVPRRQPVKVLQVEAMPQVGKVKAETELGKLSLDDFLEHPKGLVRGFVVIHKGKIVYEKYPGMLDSDSHVTASAAKVLAGLLVDVMIEEGKIDEQKTIDQYVDEFKGTSWQGIKVVDVIDMTTGLDPIDGPAVFADPDTKTARLLRAEMGEAYKGKVEKMLDVMKEATKVSEPGEKWVYTSTATQALVFLAEAASGESWANAFDSRIWSKMNVDAPLQVHLSPDGIALGHGFLSIRLRDLARFGLLYTPSWESAATEQIVTPAILERTRVPYRSTKFFRSGPSGQSVIDRLNSQDIRSAGRQWDAVWNDGDFYKSGLNTQGIYVSPVRDVVIAYFSLDPDQRAAKYLRPLVKSGLFE